MYEYEKVTLYAYSRAEALKKVYLKVAKGKIERSFYRTDTERLAGEIVNLYFLVGAIEKWRKRTEQVLKDFSEEELCLLEYRYFRRQKLLKGKYFQYNFPFSYTSFFRKIQRVTKKFSDRLKGAGFEEEDFLSDFSESEMMMKAYEKVLLGKDDCYLRGKGTNFLFKGKAYSA